MRWRPRALARVGAWVLAAAVGHLAAAEVTLLRGEEASLSLGGYARSFNGVHRLEPTDVDPLVTGLSATILRAEWRLRLPRATLEVHQRLTAMTTSAGPGAPAAGAAQGGGAVGRIGVGASVPPGRAVDLSTEIFSEPGLTVTHDLDRLVLRVWLDAVDLSVGRQAVTWGTAILFPVADLWTTFSPFELDTSQKRGIDALRSTWGLFGGAAELDLVIADRGAIDDLSFGGRVVAYTRVADLWGGIAKHWNEIFLFAGGSADAGAVKLRADLAGIYDLDAAAPQLPRATVGLDAIRPDLSLSLEVHFNGAGAAPGEAYLTYASESEPLGRGETYLMGRVYGGAALRWVPTEPLTVSASALANALDPSAMVVVSLAYAPTEAATVSLGLFRGFGTAPALAPRPELPSEFGAYGAFYYAEISAYF